MPLFLKKLRLNSSVPEEKLPVFFPDFPHNTAGVSDRNNAGRNVLGHHAPGTDYRIVPDRDARHNQRTGTDPDVIADMYIGAELKPLAS